MNYKLHEYSLTLLVMRLFEHIYRKDDQFNFIFGKHIVKTSLLENKQFLFFHSTTIKMQCKNLNSIHVAWRGQ